MIRLDLIPRSSPPDPAAAAVQPAFVGTALNIQPAIAGAVAPAAPAAAFPKTSRPSADLEAVRTGVRNVVETTTVDLSVAHSLAAGNAVILSITGTAYYIDKGPDVGIATLHIQDQTNTPVNSISVFPGDANNSLPFTFIVIENAAQAAKVLRIHYGTDIQFLPGIGGNVTFTGGVAVLQTTNGAPQGTDQATDGNHAFLGSGTVGGVAATQAFIGIANPVGSGKTIFVDGFSWMLSVQGVVQTNFNTDVQGAASGNERNRKAGGAAGVGKMRQGTIATGTFGGTPLETKENGAVNDEREHRPPAPYELPPGNGLYILRVTAAAALDGGIFYWREY